MVRREREVQLDVHIGQHLAKLAWPARACRGFRGRVVHNPISPQAVAPPDAGSSLSLNGGGNERWLDAPPLDLSCPRREEMWARVREQVDADVAG